MIEVAEAMMMEVMRVVLVEVEVVLMALLLGMSYWWIYCSDNVIVVITVQKDSSQPLPSWLRWKMDPVGPHTVATGRPEKDQQICSEMSHRPRENILKIFPNNPVPFILSWWASLVVQMVKNLPAMQETLGWEDFMEKG